MTTTLNCEDHGEEWSHPAVEISESANSRKRKCSSLSIPLDNEI